jgi:hypothetical protein
MTQKSRIRGAFRPPILLGTAIWVVLAIGSFSPKIHLGIIEMFVLLGLWMVVPLGADLIKGGANSRISGVLDWVLLTAASLATVSFFLANRTAAAWFAGSWLGVCAAFAGDGLRRFAARGMKSFTQFCFAAGEGYLLVAGAWLVASRAGFELLAFREPIVLLTAVHFHFAGFASAVFAGLTYERFPGSRRKTLLRVALLAVVCGPGILGLAFLLGPKVKLVAAFLIAVGQLGLACGMVLVGISLQNSSGRWLLFVAGASVAAGMILAAVWAMGEYPLEAFVNIRQMAEFHGVLNAVGFAVCGLMGWTLIEAERAALS